MPRSATGIYTLPPPNPVVAFTTITSAWANTTLNDMAQALTDSLDRTGRGGMTVGFKIADGTAALPGLAFTNEPATGLFRSAPNVMSVAVNTAQTVDFNVTNTAFRTNVGIGTFTPVSALHIHSASVAVKQIISGLTPTVHFQDSEAAGAARTFVGGIALGNRGAAIGGLDGDFNIYTLSFATGHSNAIRFMTASSDTGLLSEKMRVDRTGVIGIGGVTSPWLNTTTGVQITGVTSLIGLGSGNSQMVNNGYFDGTNWRTIITGFIAAYQQGNGTHIWYNTAASVAAGNAVTLVEKMTLDSSGLRVQAVHPSVKVLTGSAQLLSTDGVVICDNAANSFDVTLPSAAAGGAGVSCSLFLMTVKQAAGRNVLIRCPPGQFINNTLNGTVQFNTETGRQWVSDGVDHWYYAQY
jgi:hypothetical protein